MVEPYYAGTKIYVITTHLKAESLLKSRVMTLVPEIVIIRGPGSDLHLILEFIRDGFPVQLKKLTIYRGLANIDPGLLSSVVLKLEDCTIRGFKPGQLEVILAGIRDSTDTSLRHLDLGDVFPVWVGPDIVAGATMKLETLKAGLSRPQLEAVITRLAATEDSRLRDLDLVYGGPVNFLSLDPEVVAGALTKLETVRPQLSYHLSAGHLTALFSRICQAPVLRLTELDYYKDLSLVPPEVLTGAIQKLEGVEFFGGRMTEEQATAILTLAKEERLGRIKTITIDSVAGMESVSPALLQEARLNDKLEWFV